jgi:hypothetical protein
MRTKLLAAVVVLAASVGTARADTGLTKGTPDLKSASALAFGPHGILFIGDPAGAAIFAIDTQDTSRAGTGDVKVERVDAQIAGVLGVTDKDIRITDMKVNPESGNVYFSAVRGQSGGPAIVRLTRAGKAEPLALKDIPFAKVMIPNPGKGGKDPTGVITNMAFADGKLIVAGLSTEEFNSTLRVIPFPFKDADKGAGIQIFHGAHGRLETNAPIRTFTPYMIDGQANIVAAYTCTPLVKIPLSDLKAGAKVKGTTIAELGNMNQPLDMIPYNKGGKDYLLMTNTRHGVIKVPTEGFAKAQPITEPVRGGGTAGVQYEKISELKDVVQLDKLDAERALILVKTPAGFDVKTVPLP